MTEDERVRLDLLDLKPRTLNSLARRGFVYVDDLDGWSESALVRRVDNFGEVAARDLQRALVDDGFPRLPSGSRFDQPPDTPRNPFDVRHPPKEPDLADAFAELRAVIGKEIDPYLIRFLDWLTARIAR
jgi:hypothetical protein